uniref:Uncharacterized protein n=1 Tax=Romanomermis culicivorax TaxID=13658 RepID=A0A915L6B9_ROMCU
SDNPSPLPPVEEPASPQSGEISPPILVHHVRPNQDPQFDEENYSMRRYAVETDKGEENVVTGQVVDGLEHPAGKVVAQHTTTDSMNDSSRISNEFEKVDSKSKPAQNEEEEEEEEEGEVVIPSLNKNRLQILKRQERFENFLQDEFLQNLVQRKSLTSELCIICT